MVLRAELDLLLGDRDAPARPLIDQVAAEAAVAGRDRIPRAAIELVLELDRWLRSHDVRLEF